MTVEALLAYAHILCILATATFLASEAALCRAEWINAAVVKRLVRLDLYYGISALALLASGLARSLWGFKGAHWYWTQPLLYAKLALFIAIALMSLGPTLRFIGWHKALRASGALPPPAQVRATRQLIMIEAHLLAVIPLLAVFLAR